ncbi:MAG: ribokinase [Acidimicrobiia bacterium]
MSEIAVVGSLNLDTTVRVPRLPVPGETVLGTDHFDDTGGKGANQAVAAARLGRSVAMVGMVGEDDVGRRLLASLAAEGVDVEGVAVDGAARSGVAVITVDEHGENMIVVDPGANGTFGPSAFSTVSDTVASADVVLLQLEIPIATVAAAAAAARGVVILNPAPAAELSPQLLEQVDILVPNATELGHLTGGVVPASAEEAAVLARRLAGPEAIVVTLGGEGAVLVTGEAEVHVPAPDIDPVDPTAAGDAFCGGLADATVRGEALDDAVLWAVHCGAAAATRWGAQASLPTRDDVMRLEAEE